MLKRKRGQSMLEYVLLITVIILVIIYAANSVVKPKATQQVDQAGTLMGNAISAFKTAVAFTAT